MELPLYCLRKYTRLFKESGYFCIETPKDRYVLDYETIVEPDYVDRRLKLLADTTKPYKLYPISLVLETLDEVASLKSSVKHFYTNSGRVVNLKLTSFYQIKPYKVQNRWLSDSGEYILYVKDIGPIKAPKYNGESYVLMVEFNKARLLFGYTDDPSSARKRIKL